MPERDTVRLSVQVDPDRYCRSVIETVCTGEELVLGRIMPTTAAAKQRRRRWIRESQQRGHVPER